MGNLLEVIGWIIIVIAGLVLLLGGAGSGGSSAAYVGAILAAAPIAFSGIVIVVFGNMLTELKALRRSSERLEELFGEVVAGMRRRAAQQEASPLAGKVTCRSCGRQNDAQDDLCACGMPVRG